MIRDLENIDITSTNTYILEEEEEIINSMPTDYIGKRYFIQGGSMMVEVYPRVPKGNPKNSLSSKFKGDIGEDLAKILCNLTREDIDNLYIINPSSCTYDIESHLCPIKIDVKTGYEVKSGHENGKATEFHIHLATNRAGANAKKISLTKFKKNYETEGIHYLLCICIFNNPYIVPRAYLIPTSTKEVRDNLHFAIPSSGCGKYAKYQLDFSKVMVAKTAIEE